MVYYTVWSTAIKCPLRAAETPVIIGATRNSSTMRPELIEHLKDIEDQAYNNGFEKGKEAGFSIGLQEIKKSLSPLLEALRKPLAKLDEQVEKELVELALAIAQQIVRREIRTDPGQVVAVIRESIDILPVAAPRIKIRLNPDDLALAREAMPVAESEEGIQFIEDPTLTRGGCKVVTDTSLVDGTIESRIATIAAKLLGGERDTDVSTD